MIFSASIAMGSAVSKATAAEPGIDSLKQNVVNSFLQKANTPSAQLHKRLESLNQADGRNPSGIFPTTLKASDIQVVSIAGENQFGRYCSQINGKPGHSSCQNGVSETYLILVPYKMGVRKAVEYNSIQFIIKASKNAEWKIDQREKEYDRQESLKIDEPVEVSVQPSSDKANK